MSVGSRSLTASRMGDANVGAGCEETEAHRAWRLARERRLTRDALESQGARQAAGVTRHVHSSTGKDLRRAEVLALLAYGDIIDLPAHSSYSHPHQPPEVRAAQFAPFAALSGYGDEISETARLTQRRPELADDEREAIARALSQVARLVDAARGGTGAFPPVDLTVFVPDPRKQGGSCRRLRGRATRIDRGSRALTVGCVQEGAVVPVRVPIDDIVALDLASETDGGTGDLDVAAGHT